MPVAPSARMSRHSRRNTGSAASVLCQTNGAMRASAISQRRKLSVTGSTLPRSARPATKLPDQNSAANASARAGERTAARMLAPRSDAVDEGCSTAAVMTAPRLFERGEVWLVSEAAVMRPASLRRRKIAENAQRALGRLSYDAADAGISRQHDRLGPGADTEFGKNARNLVAHGLLALAKARGNRGVVQASRDQGQHRVFARGQAGLAQRSRSCRRHRRRKARNSSRKLRPGRFVGQQDVVAAFQRHEAGRRDQRCQLPAFFERNPCVVARVHDQCRDTQACRLRADIDLIQRLDNGDSVLRRGRDALQIIEPLVLLARPVRNELRREDLPERRVVAPPAEANELDKGLGFLALLLASLLAATRPWP